MSQEGLKLASRILSRPSVTPDDCGCQEIIFQALEPAGFTRQIISRGSTTNSWIRRGMEEPLFIFAGHTDVVPPGKKEDWKFDPFTPTISDDHLYARGAADMKTSDAAFAVAAKRFVHDYPNHKGSIALLLTSDEEGDGKDGTVFVVEELKKQGIRPQWCIVGEPSSSQKIGDTIKTGRRGSLNGKVIFKGIQGHVAYPEKVLNPIHIASRVIAEMVSRQWGKEYPGFPLSSLQVSNIQAGTGAVNVVPGECTVTFNIRFNPSITADELIHELEELFSKYSDSYEVHWQKSAVPFSTSGTSLRDALSGAIREVCGIDAVFSTSGGTSDGRFIAGWCPDLNEFGPTNNTIHKVNENIGLDEVHRLEEIYYLTLKKLLTD